ncbi:MAG: alpha/beta fold hydrolase [Traorella sp.]
MKINGYDISKGQALVFLHGWGGNHMMMNPHVSLLSHDYRCINFDLFGFGLSEDIHNYHSFLDYVEALHAYLKALEIESPIFIAHSFGARLAICYAHHYDTKALILTGAAGLKAPLSFQKKIKIYLHKHHFKQKGSYDYENASPFLKKVLVEVVNMDLSDKLKNIQIPCLLIWGEKDQQTPLWMGKKMKRLLNNSELIIFKGEDHFAYYHEYERFCFIVKEFLLEHQL